MWKDLCAQQPQSFILCSLVLLPPVVSAAQYFNDWAATNLASVPLQSGPLDDPDNDGAVNLAEFAFGTDPLVSGGLGNAILPVYTSTDGVFQITLFEQQGHQLGVQIDVDATADLVHWIRPWWFRTMTNSLPSDPPGSEREVLTTYRPDTDLFFARGVVTLLQAGPETATYYVATNGSDSALGTSINTPFRSLAKAVSAASPGNLIYIRGGTYTTNATISISSSHNGTARIPSGCERVRASTRSWIFLRRLFRPPIAVSTSPPECDQRMPRLGEL